MSSELIETESQVVEADRAFGIQAIREGILRANLARLCPEDQPSEAQIEAWRMATNASEWFQAEDGLVFRCNDGMSRDTQRAHELAIEPMIAKIELDYHGPILLEGIDPPWMLKLLVDAQAPVSYPNFRQRVLVLQADWNEFLDGLAYVDFGDELGSDRFQWFVGKGASVRLLSWVCDRSEDAPPTESYQNPMVHVKAKPDGPALVEEMKSHCIKNAAWLIEKMKKRSVRSKACWGSRFAMPGNKHEPLRVLIPTARQSTYLKHASADLAKALTELGCECKVQVEENDSQVHTKSMHLRSVHEFDPDLIVSINYPRSVLGEHIPTDIPYICWVQDAVGHLFDRQVGESIGEMDFVVGMVKPELIDLFGYPAEQTRWMPMVASKSKFGHEPIDEGFDSEIAWVTHQSEHPNLFRDRLVGNMKVNAPAAAKTFAKLLDDVEQLVTTITTQNLRTHIDSLIDQAFFPNGVPEGAKAIRTSMYNDMINPFAERVFRHQAAQWAANIAVRRGWRFKLFGKGWEEHPQLAKFAAGPLEHGDELGACYRNSVVQIHASINQVVHQRVSECLLSGGLPICRAISNSFGYANLLVCMTADLEYDKDLMTQGVSTPWYVEIDSCSQASEFIEHLRRLEICDEQLYIDGKLKWSDESLALARERLSVSEQRETAEMVVAMSDLYFANEAQLEVIIERAMGDKAARNRRIFEGVEQMPRAMTTDGIAESMLKMIRTKLDQV